MLILKKDKIMEEKFVFESLDELNEAKKKEWIQKMFKSAKKKGTVGRCSGEKFGGPSCKAGTKQYNAAKNLRKISKKK
jgi:hypothetical protein